MTGAAGTLLCGLVVVSGAAQQRAVSAPELGGGVSLALRVEDLYGQGRHRESLELLKGHLGHDQRDYLAWVWAAREALVLGYSEPTPDSAKSWLRRSITYGEGAQALNPSGEEGRYVTLAAKGRLALVENPIERARLGREVEREARALLALDSLHAGAHNALGKVYFEVARLSGIERFLGRAWIGGDLLGRANWEAAEHHLRRAVELQPERNFHHLDLGALLVERERYAEARRELRETLAVPLEIPAQQGFREEARRLLEAIEGRGGDEGDAAGEESGGRTR